MPKKILIVDDDVTFSELYRERLQISGYAVQLVYNGADALGAVEKLMPDLIVLDLMMPGMSGEQVLTKLKSNKKTADIPVIIMTALSNPKFKGELMAKAQAFAVKSEILPKDFVELVEKTLKK